MSLFARRLKIARKAAGYSQERLGLEAGFEPESASARMNQYERGKHTPAYPVSKQIADALGIPAAYFYAEDDLIAQLLLATARLSSDQKLTLLAQAEQLVKQDTPSPTED